jgi:lysozyme
LNAYPDPLTGGLPITIGWGSTKDFNGQPFKLGRKITQDYADKLLTFDLEERFLPALRKIPYWNEMNDNQRGALLSFAYNLGARFYNSSGFNTITRVLKNKEWTKVPDALYLYRNPGTKVEKGLARRRTAEGKLWNS